MTNFNSKNKGKDIWSEVNPDEVAAAIASLGDRIEQLKDETWRFNLNTRLSNSLWHEIINKLQLDDSERTRHALYDIWHFKRRNIDKLVEKKIRIMLNEENDIEDDNISGTKEIIVSENNCSVLPPEPSIPLPQPPNTRGNDKCADDNFESNSSTEQLSLVFTAYEWKDAFSRTHQVMKKGWNIIFDKKLTSSGITCSLKFKSPYIKRGKRKRSCQFFCCYARCTKKLCTRQYKIILQNQPEENISILFLVKISGEESHNLELEIGARHLSGYERYLVGKHANCS